jgi:hypothetical protein
MNIEIQVKQLTELVAELIPTVDQLVETQARVTKEMTDAQALNIRLVDSMEKLLDNIDKSLQMMNRFDERITNIERTLFK